MNTAFSDAAFSTCCAASSEYSAMEEKPHTPFFHTRAEMPEMSERVLATMLPESRITRRLRFSCPRSSVCAPASKLNAPADKMSFSMILSFYQLFQSITSILIRFVLPVKPRGTPATMTATSPFSTMSICLAQSTACSIRVS